ncbi:cytoplasmic protein [Kwoniella mangroviensis CBS 10435]|uniref:Cytoplasmic protein n=1 Tax=Kwoniella mangroviensis CBS 10435 TaxID=1331196 RepID=A0A1B9IPZ8_9TREE|nr:cytoplasmic protein [Kwoniella mangroviensis CBS 10435]
MFCAAKTTSYELQDDLDSSVIEKCTMDIEQPVSREYDDKAEELKGRLRDLRVQVQEAKVDWYVVPSEDEHQSEEIGESDKRREWISGFTGSAGTALIPSSSIDSEALLFVDSRYWIQAGQQVVEGWKVVRVGASGGSGKDAVVGGWVEWLLEEVGDGSRIGIDPKLLSIDLARSIKSHLESSDSSTKLIPLTSDLVDKIHSPPERSTAPINHYPISFSGENTSSKLDRVRSALSDHLTSSSSSRLRSREYWIYVLPTLPSVAWLLNFRCPSDIPFCPVAYTYLVLTPDKCVIFVDERKITDEALKEDWEKSGVEVRPYGIEEVGKYVKELQQRDRDETKKRQKKVLTTRECSWALADACKSDIEVIPCPVDRLKAVKNETEIQGFKNAYLRDGRAMVRWITWLEKILVQEKKKVGEWAAAQTLTRYRRREELFAGLAYDDISASGPNGALPHYAPKRGEDRVIEIDSTYVIDSGAQYQDGTIDTTRTLYFGKTPSPEVKRAYTRVLQGHLAVSSAIFPRGMTADRLNMIARGPLYQDGLDFGHGIGHGIGTYLAVHENPMFPRNGAFEPGNITSIEPGYYKEGEWGIRIESVILCKPVDTLNDQSGHFLSFERITQVPIQTSLVDYKLLTKSEIRWLNDHNTSVQEQLMPLLQGDEDKEVRDWLRRNCKPKKIWPWTGA